MHPVFLSVRFTAVGFQLGEQHGNTMETKEKHKETIKEPVKSHVCAPDSFVSFACVGEPPNGYPS